MDNNNKNNDEAPPSENGQGQALGTSAEETGNSTTTHNSNNINNNPTSTQAGNTTNSSDEDVTRSGLTLRFASSPVATSAAASAATATERAEEHPRQQQSVRQNALRGFASGRPHKISTAASSASSSSSSRSFRALSASSLPDHQSLLRKQATTTGTRIERANRSAPSLPSAIEEIRSARPREDAPPVSRSSPSLTINNPMSGTGGSFRHRNAPMPLISSGDSEEEPESPLLSPPRCTGNGWSVVDISHRVAGGAPPCQRSLHTAAILNECMYVFGGYDGTARVNDFHCFSFAEKRWSPVLPSAASGPPPSPRDRHVAVVHGNSFYVFGGFDGTSRISDFVGFDFSSMAWREVLPISGEPPSPRHSHSAVVYGSSMFVFGGYDGSYRSDFHEFDFERNEWSIIPPAGRPPRARYRATCAVHKSTMILFGGHDGTRHLADTHMFDFETRLWSTLVTDGITPLPRDSHVSVVHDNSMYVFGGSTGSAMNDLHELQLSLTPSSPAKWYQIPANGTITPEHRFCHVGVVYGEAMYIFGGYDGSNRLNDFIQYEIAVDDLSFEVPPPTIISDLRALLNDESLSDITFIVEGQPVYAHKIMLTRCSYFRAMFMGDMIESNQSTIHMQEVSRPIFMAVLEYLYTDKIQIALEDAMELFVAADLFCIPRLKTMCEKRMLQSITIDNAATIFHASDVHCATALRQKTLKYILAHFEAVSKTDAFEEMARGNVELVFEILRQR